MSNPTDEARAQGVRRTPGRPVSRVVLLVMALLTVALGTTPAAAYWTTAGAGSAAAQTGTLPAPTDVRVPDDAIIDVPITWTAATGGPTPEGYYVTRHLGPTATAVCASNPTALLTGTSCVDSTAPDGQYTYVVTAVFRTWTASSTASSVVTVVNPAQLAFVSQPSDTEVDQAISPPITVILRSAAGDPVAYAGIAVTLSIETHPAGGDLSGTRTVTTDANGVATFDALAVDAIGTGYVLVATSPGLTSARSSAFTVLAPPLLGQAGRYSVLGRTGVVSTLNTNVSGELGVGPGYFVSGFPPGTVAGDIHLGDADAVAALADVNTAYAELRLISPDAELTGDQSGQTLTPGVYHSTAALGITGDLTLDGQGDPDAVFIIQVDAALNTAAGGRILLTNGTRAANVFWVVNGAAGLGAGTQFKGTILADGAITLGLGTELIGRALATGTVTMANNTVRFTPALPPTITITGGTAAVTKDVTPAIAGTSNAPVGTAVKLTVAGQTLTTTIQSGGTWTVTAAALLAGSYSAVAQLRDASGNGAKASQTLTVEVNPDPVGLGSAASFSVLALTTVVSTGSTHLSGDLGVSPGVVITGFPPGTLGGTVHAGDSTAAAAQADLLTAIADAEGRVPHTEFAGDLGGRTFHLGVHHAAAAAGLTGTVTLDGEDNPNAVFIFQIGGALTAAASCQVHLVNGAQASNVFWVVNGAAGTGASCAFSGNILARGAITLGATTNLVGQAMSRDAVTLSGNSVTGVTPAAAARRSSDRYTVSSSPSPSDIDGPSDSPPSRDEPTPTPDPMPSNSTTTSTEDTVPTPTPDPMPSNSTTTSTEDTVPTPMPSDSTTASTEDAMPTPSRALSSPTPSGAS